MPIHDWNRVDAGIFHDFHHEWISTIRRALNDGLLPDDYYALAEQQAGEFGPDVLTLLGFPRDQGHTQGSLHSAGGTAQLAPPRTRFRAESGDDSLRRKISTIVVRHVTGDDVVAVVEVLSPANKRSRAAFNALLRKACDLLFAGVHLLILDVFPPTRRDPQRLHAALWHELSEEAFTPPAGEPLTLAAYQSEDKLRAFVETTAVGGTLPDMPLFLDAGTHVMVPLEATYNAAFATVPARWRAELVLPAS